MRFSQGPSVNAVHRSGILQAVQQQDEHRSCVFCQQNRPRPGHTERFGPIAPLPAALTRSPNTARRGTTPIAEGADDVNIAHGDDRV